MQPITPNEKILAFQRVQICASSLVHDQIISEPEFRVLIDRAVELYDTPLNNIKKMEKFKCLIDHPNGET